MEKPTLPKGTRDFGPAVMAKRQYILDTIKRVFQTYGFQPLETPAMENLSTLTGKYGDEGDQLLFKVLNSGDFLKGVDPKKLQQADSKSIVFDIAEKGLKYDLTVPFARYVVMNRHEITFPFKRYQIQPVWRADRPQKGRYREFYQCDADVVGTDSLICEAEIILMIKAVCHNLGIDNYTIKINHRAILSGIAALVHGEKNETALFVAIDKLDKLGEGAVREELAGRGFDGGSINTLFEILGTRGTTQEKLTQLSARFADNAKGAKGLKDIHEILQWLSNYGQNDEHVELDISLARGLIYYTGAIFEVKINNVAIGSVSGGGRYDDLTGVFGWAGVSGVGFSFGVDRLFDALEELQRFPTETLITTQVLIVHLDESSREFGTKLLSPLRSKGIASEIYPDVAKVKKQLDYANKKKIPYVIIIGSDEMKTGKLTLKNMQAGDQQALTIEEILEHLRS